jgi:hypothetical protein
MKSNASLVRNFSWNQISISYINSSINPISTSQYFEYTSRYFKVVTLLIRNFFRVRLYLFADFNDYYWSKNVQHQIRRKVYVLNGVVGFRRETLIVKNVALVDEEDGVAEDRADDEGGQALRYGGLQEQEVRQAARLPGHSSGNCWCSPHHTTLWGGSSYDPENYVDF